MTHASISPLAELGCDRGPIRVNRYSNANALVFGDNAEKVQVFIFQTAHMIRPDEVQRSKSMFVPTSILVGQLSQKLCNSGSDAPSDRQPVPTSSVKQGVIGHFGAGPLLSYVTQIEAPPR